MIFYFASGFLVLSGIASLTYQVTWVRLLGLSMGSTSTAISTVLAAFFLGMALGSFTAERITRHHIQNLKPYIVLELLIGLTGLALLPILLHLDSLLALFPAVGATLSFKFLVALIVLSIPTVCMGATFPVMASILIRRQDEIGLRMSQLYSLNTAGAVAGAALSGFVFIPIWGLDGAIYIAFALNISIVLMASYVDWRWVLPQRESAPALTSPEVLLESAAAPFRNRALIVLFATGWVSIATQVGWTKYLVIFTGTTIYGFAIILTIFLSGIAAGSWAIRRHLEKINAPQVWMATGLMLLGAALIATRVGLSTLPVLYEAINHWHVAPAFQNTAKYGTVLILLFVPTFLLGALFPLNLKLYCGTLASVRSRIGKAYALNTLASIGGALFAGFWFIPHYGTDRLLTTMALVILGVALLFLWTLKRGLPRYVLATLVVVAIAMSWGAPHLSYQALISSVDYQWDNDAQHGKKPNFLFLKEGKAGVISLVSYDNIVAKLQNNGLNESVIHMHDPNRALLAETLLGLLPYMLHADPHSAFVVGFGGGITTRALTLTDIQSIRVVELEPAVVDAGRSLFGGGEIPTLRDPRVHLDFNDARNTLLVETQTYDIIAAQPSHPWLAGAANVFTRQFWGIVKSRLNEGGVFAQWVNLFKMDATTLRSIFQAFYQVFPYGVSFADIETGDLILIGSKHPLNFDYARIDSLLKQPKIRATLHTHEIYTTQDVLGYFALSRAEAVRAAGNARPNTDTNILSEVRLSALAAQPTGAEDPYTFLRANFNLDLAAYVGKDVAERLYQQADNSFAWEDMFTVNVAAKQLAQFDPVRARGIEYERVWRTFDFSAAQQLFARYQEWPDRTYKQHALLLVQQGQMQDAQKILARIRDPLRYQSAYAQVLYQAQSWAALTALNVQNDEARKWRLLGDARLDNDAAAEALDKLDIRGAEQIPQMRVWLRYYAQPGKRSFDKEKEQRFHKTIERETRRLQTALELAVKNKEAQRVQLLSQALREITL